MFEITEEVLEDTSIVSLESFEFLPVSGTNLNTAGLIRIRVENSDNFYLPSQAYISIAGCINNGEEHYENTKKITLLNNGLMFLFDCMKYELNGVEIESVYEPGFLSLMTGLSKYSESFNTGPGLNIGWRTDTGDGKVGDQNAGYTARHKWFFSSTPVGTFRVAIPLSHIFGFAFDYNKVIYGLTHTLTFVRNSSDNNALIRSSAAGDQVTDGNIKISKLSLCLPRITPSDVAKYDFLKLITEKVTVPVQFRMNQCMKATVPQSTSFTYRLGVRSSTERPRWIILGFQTARDNSQTVNNTIFDHCSLTNAYVLLNNERYPATDLNLNFAENMIENSYIYYCNFMKDYLDIDPVVNNPSLDPLRFKTLYPLYVFNLSHQSERMKDSVLDITLRAFFSAAPAVNTVAYISVLSERQLRFRSDGNKLNIVF